jgi:hypothetical protein
MIASTTSSASTAMRRALKASRDMGGMNFFRASIFKTGHQDSKRRAGHTRHCSSIDINNDAPLRVTAGVTRPTRINSISRSIRLQHQPIRHALPRRTISAAITFSWVRGMVAEVLFHLQIFLGNNTYLKNTYRVSTHPSTPLRRYPQLSLIGTQSQAHRE